jgi:hypothetical protein
MIANTSRVKPPKEALVRCAARGNLSVGRRFRAVDAGEHSGHEAGDVEAGRLGDGESILFVLPAAVPDR